MIRHNINCVIHLFRRVFLSIWMTFVDNLTKLEMINLVSIDEIHSFVEFGLSCKKFFLSLRNKLFNKIIVRNKILKLPFLCTTAM